MRGFLHGILNVSLPLFALILIGYKGKAQSDFRPLSHSLYSFNQQFLQDDSLKRSSSFRANLTSDRIGHSTLWYRSYIPSNAEDSAFLIRKRYKDRSWVYRKVFKENFIIFDTGKVYITIDPLVNFSSGRENVDQRTTSFDGTEIVQDNSSQNLYNNTRGLLLKADFGKKLSIESYFYENQARLPGHVASFARDFGVVPGQGRWKDFKEGEALDFAYSGGYVSYTPWRTFNVQIGHHKHFIGEGYRSLILSDNSFNYPFARFNLWFFKNKLSYSVMYASFQDLERLPLDIEGERPFRRKGGSFHTLEYRFNKRIKLSLYQGAVWQTMDDQGRTSIDGQMFNPVIYASGLYANSTSNTHKPVMGAGFKVNPIDMWSLYGQFTINPDVSGSQSIQLGTRVYPATNLLLQLEYNSISQTSYWKKERNDAESYSHYGQPLAHPLGSDFSEFPGYS